MKKPKKKSGSPRIYRLQLLFTKQEMLDIREDVAIRIENKEFHPETSVADKLLYSIAGTFHSRLTRE